MSDAITAAARKFIALRREKLTVKAERNAVLCTVHDEQSCFRSVRIDGELEDLPQDEWCDGCKRRQKLHEAYHKLTAKAIGAINALENAVNKEPKP